MKTASEAMDGLDGIGTTLNPIYNAMLDDMHECAVEWAGLKQAGGGRDDHATQYLKRILPHLVKLRRASDNIVLRLEKLIEKPFGE